MQLTWDDPRLSVAGDSRHLASLRLQQSWYREQVLKARYGEHVGATGVRPISSLLHRADVVARPGLNFVSPVAASYAEERAAAVVSARGEVDLDRLRHDMLSSQALAFSIFGELRARPDRGLDVVRAFLDPQATGVELMECQWSPPADLLGDGSWFDVAVVTARADGTRHLVGVEVKYGAPFCRTIYNSLNYRVVHDRSCWFEPGSASVLVGPTTNQLWRRSLLAAACAQQHVLGVASASVALVCPAEDAEAARALAGLSAALRDPAERCRVVSLEALAAGLREPMGPGPAWAALFANRYLDPPPIPAELPDLTGDAEALGH